MPVDYWEEDQLFEAQKIVGQFSEDDWNSLEHAFLSKNNNWKCRSIQSIGDLKSTRVVLILLKCLDESDLDVVETAIDSLRLIVPEGGIELSKSQQRVLEKMISKSGIRGKVTCDLKQKCKHD